jgi:hypothetical protein
MKRLFVAISLITFTATAQYADINYFSTVTTKSIATINSINIGAEIGIAISSC